MSKSYSQQSMFDLALQRAGTIEAVIEIAMLSNLSITDTLLVDDKVTIGDIDDKDMIRYYDNNQIKPATAIQVAADFSSISTDSSEYYPSNQQLSEIASIPPYSQQSMFDLALQRAGTIEAVIEMAMLSDLSITDLLLVEKQVIQGNVENKKITRYYDNNQIKPATSLPNSLIERLDGIENWAVGYNFIVI